MGAFFVLILTGILYVIAGCPDPDKGVTHPDLESVLRELDAPYDAAVERAERALPEAPKKPQKRAERAARHPFGGGEL